MDLWLMSCRVFKRDMEFAMLDAIVERSLGAGIDRVVGYYLPTAKIGMVADFYSKMGFQPCSAEDPAWSAGAAPSGGALWQGTSPEISTSG